MTSSAEGPVTPLVTRLLRKLSESGEGDVRTRDELMAIVYGELHRIAEACFRSQPASHTLQPTALVHEAYARLVGSDSVDVDGRHQFFALAARAMRQILVDHARAKHREKRGGAARPVAADAPIAADAAALPGLPVAADVGELIDLDDALGDLAALDPRQAQLVELRFFGGLEMTEVAACMAVSISTAEREWRVARAWLGQRLARS